MSASAAIAAALFPMPGDPGASIKPLLRDAAAAHLDLLAAASLLAERDGDPLLSLLVARLNDPAVSTERQRLLCHPMLVEGLHLLSRMWPALECWHQSVASPSILDLQSRTGHSGSGMLGNMALALSLRTVSNWCGELELCTDMFGRLRFPLSDCSIILRVRGSPASGVLAHEPVTVSADGRQICWYLPRSRASPFMVMPHETCRRLLAESDVHRDAGRPEFPDQHIRPQFQWAAPLCPAGARYDPIHFEGPEPEPGLTGDIAKGLHDAVARNSPVIHQEFCRCMHAIQGFSLPVSGGGTLQSFSDPTTPGLMAINVPYMLDGLPCLSPFCFTWLGHELGHTKVYLVNNIACSNGWAFVRNAAEQTNVVPRYRRALPVRTLFQIPYTHLYEWVLLMDFMQMQFRGLPWDVGEDPVAFGDDLQAEISESFDLIDGFAHLTPWGNAAIAHFRKLARRAANRWQRLRRTSTAL